jgi:hypothetical protein
MDHPFLFARLIHIAGGVFWAGAMIFNAAFLLPSMRDAGPDAAKVAAGLMRRRFLDVIPAVAILTILSGLYLFWRVSAGFSPGFVHSPIGMTYALGLVASLTALGFGLGVVRPSMLRAAALSQAAAGLGGPEAAASLATAQALRARAGRAAPVVAWLLVLATVTMAVARYL